MSAIDPKDALLALGVITREQLLESAKVDREIATTSIGRLIAVGVDAAELMQALSSLTGIPLATPAQLADAQPIDGLPPALERALREMPAAPLARGADGVLNIAVAEPQATHRLAALGIQRHRAYLALELHVRDVIDRLLELPESDADMLGGPIEPPSSSSSSSQLAPPLVLDLAPPAPSPPSSPSPPLVLDLAPPVSPPARAPSLPPPSPPSPPAPSPSPPLVVDLATSPAPEPMERARPVREKYAKGVKPANELPPGGVGVEVTPAAAPAPTPRPTLELARESSSPMPSSSSLPQSRPAVKAPPPKPSAPVAERRKSRAPLFLAFLLVVGAGAGGVFFGPQIRERFTPPPPVDETPQKQAKELDLAKADAMAGNPTNAIIHCESVVALGSSTALAHEAQLLHAEQEIANGELDKGLDELQALIDSLPALDPLHDRAVASLLRLKPKAALPAVVDAGVAVAIVDAGAAPDAPKGPDLDHDAAEVAKAKEKPPSPVPGGDGQ